MKQHTFVPLFLCALLLFLVSFKTGDPAGSNLLGRNWDPLLSAGDSDGDYEMLSGFPGMKMSLIWNRSKGGDIGKLYLQAIKQAGSDFPRYILQGRNEKNGSAIPGTESILL